MIECIVGGTALAAFIWSREDKKTELIVQSLEEVRDKISLCERRAECYVSHQQIITRDLQSLQGRIAQDDKLFDMLKVLQKEWKDIQDRHRMLEERQTNIGYENSNSYYI